MRSKSNTLSSSKSLPKGWQCVKIGDIADVSTGGTPDTNHPEYYGGDIRWLKSGDVKGIYIDEVPNRISQLGLENSNARIHPVGSVMLAMSGQGKTRGTSAILRVPSTCSQSVAAILPTEYAIPEIIHYALVNRYDETRRITGDNERTGLNLKLIREIEIPLPPLDEQRRIANLLNEQLAAVEAARKAAEGQLQVARQLESVYLANLFDGELAHSWERKTIGSVAKVQTGYAFKSEWFTPDGVRLLRNANIFQGYIDWTDSVRLPLERRHEFKVFEMNKGDIVLSLDRPLVNNGLKVARLAEKDLPSLLLQRVARFQLSDSINSDYLYYFLRSPFFIDEITEHDQSIGVPHVSPKQVESVELSLPDLKTQEKLAKDVQEKISYANQLCDSLESQLAEINRLPASLLRGAFAGRA